MTDIPFIDRMCADVSAEPCAVWDALVHRLSREEGGGPAVRAFVAAIAVREREPDGSFPEPGSAIRGFRVAAAQPPRRLLLEGRHRFSAYELDFELSEVAGGTELCAITRAAFPGIAGRLYRAAVIDTRFHRVAVRRILGYVTSRAERA